MNAEGEIPVCPDPDDEGCDSPHIRRNSRSTQRQHAWWCRECGAGFDEPAYREPKGTRPQDQTPTNLGIDRDLVGIWDGEGA